MNHPNPKKTTLFKCLRKALTLACALGMTSGLLNAAITIAPVKNADGTVGLAVSSEGRAALSNAAPLRISLWDGAKDAQPVTLEGGYLSLGEDDGKWVGKGSLKTPKGVVLEFTDFWTAAENVLRLKREVRVNGKAPGGFNSVAALKIANAKPWPEMEWFAPGMIYGNFDHMRPNSFGSGNYYQQGNYTVWIREDRMPAPLLATRLPSGVSVAVLNSAPDGATTAAEGQSYSWDPVADARFRFGAILVEERLDGTSLGYAMPGSEGSLSYERKAEGANGAKSAHKWRQRYTPFEDGLAQNYEVSFRLDRAADTNELVFKSWRWAWQTLKPQVNPQPVDELRSHMVDVLVANTYTVNGRTGIHTATDASPKEQPPPPNPKVILGFCGYALGSAEMMLAEAERTPDSERGRKLRELGEKCIETFLKVPMNPPTAEGILLKTGAPAISSLHSAKRITEEHPIFLRSFCDDMKALMRAYEREKKAGREHPEWLAWVRQFGDWLLTQEQAGGGFPRSWRALSGELLSDSTTGTFNAVPFYVQLYRITGHKPYYDAALRAGEFSWGTGQAAARFTGGTIDNPDIIDKEAATLSLEAYLSLHTLTKDKKWLDRARIAGDIAETWMYIWDVPTPADADDGKLRWKRGQSTVGIQLIASGHSLNDAYMAWDVESYARLSRGTGDPHYMEVARILLHNTKAMAGRPGDLRGTRGPGWQQEHWSFSIPRGLSRHNAWLPWVTVSHLRGINDLIDLDPELYRQLADDKLPSSAK